jgi:predicted dehydrogenase
MRVALLGTGHVHAADYLTAIAADPGAQLVTSLRTADVAVIASATAAHGGHLRRVVAAGLPALVEKPLASTAAETAELATVIDRAGAPVTTAMFLRCAPALRRVRSLLAADALGELAGVHARFTHPGLLDGVFSGRSAWMLKAGGFADLAIHLLDLLRWLRPDSDLTARSAHLRHTPGYPMDVGGAALLDWGGVPVTLHAGWTSRPGGVHLRIEGSTESITVNNGTLSLDSGHTETHDPPAAMAALTAFLGELRGQPSWQAPTTADIVASGQLLEDLAALGS